MALPRITTTTVVKLIVASLAVGLALAWLGKDPIDLLYWVRDGITDVLGDASGWVQWALKYIFIGAVVVVPIWLVHYLWRAMRGKS